MFVSSLGADLLHPFDLHGPGAYYNRPAGLYAEFSGLVRDLNGLHQDTIIVTTVTTDRNGGVLILDEGQLNKTTIEFSGFFHGGLERFKPC